MAYSFTLTTERVEFEGGYLTVRGLSLPDLIELVNVNRNSAIAIYDKISGRNKDGFTSDDVSGIIQEIAVAFPHMLTHALVLAADAAGEPTAFEDFSRLPLDVQVTAAEKAVAKTFQMSGGLKNFIETVNRIAASVGGLDLKNQSPLQALKSSSAT